MIKCPMFLIEIEENTEAKSTIWRKAGAAHEYWTAELHTRVLK